MTSAETNYAQIERELLAICYTCLKFRRYVDGHAARQDRTRPQATGDNPKEASSRSTVNNSKSDPKSLAIQPNKHLQETRGDVASGPTVTSNHWYSNASDGGWHPDLRYQGVDVYEWPKPREANRRNGERRNTGTTDSHPARVARRTQAYLTDRATLLDTLSSHHWVWDLIHSWRVTWIPPRILEMQIEGHWRCILSRTTERHRELGH